MDGVEHNAFVQGGAYVPSSMSGMNIFFAQTSARMVQLLREIAGSGLIMQPSERDLAHPEFRPIWKSTWRGKDVDVAYKARLLGWPMTCSVLLFGMRQRTLRYWHGGDPNRNRINLLHSYEPARHHRAHQDIGRTAVGAWVDISGVFGSRIHLAPLRRLVSSRLALGFALTFHVSRSRDEAGVAGENMLLSLGAWLYTHQCMCRRVSKRLSLFGEE